MIILNKVRLLKKHLFFFETNTDLIGDTRFKLFYKLVVKFYNLFYRLATIYFLFYFKNVSLSFNITFINLDIAIQKYSNWISI